MSEIKNFVAELCGKPVLVFGCGKSGLSLIRTLKEAGVKIVAGDDRSENLVTVRDMGVDILDETAHDFFDFALLLLSPGIPLTHPEPHDVVKKALAADLEIICDIELFHRLFPERKTIGITGTNGKSTTSTLLQHILKECGQESCLGGNIGTAVFDMNIQDKDAWAILEISSFQMDLCPTFRPDISVILNLTPDHIDRHGSMEEYISVKERIFEPAQKSDYNIAIICTDDVHTQKIYERTKISELREVIEVSTLKELSSGAYVEEDHLFYGLEDEMVNVGDLSESGRLRGMHNYQNASSAYIVARKLGLDHDKIWAAMQSFPGLNHRQYTVRTINGVEYINDSKSTNAASAAVALSGRSNVYWIVGGRQKKNGLEGLEEFFPHIKHAFLIGEAMEDFAQWLGNYSLEYTRCYKLANAVADAHVMAQACRGQPGGAGVVLLSPACASFDQFESFEDRGNQFTDFVNALEG